MKRFAAFLLCFLWSMSLCASAQEAPGWLCVQGTSLVDEAGQPVLLQGVSTHGVAEYPQFVRKELFEQLHTQWNANLIRLACYASSYSQESMALVKKGIDAAIAEGLYVIVDWHILEEQDPMVCLPNALAFFGEIAKAYGDCPNVIYEICNEPNGDTTWETVKDYAACILPVIRTFSPKGLVLVGTPNFSTALDSPMASPIENGGNLMYTFHFYAATNKEESRNWLSDAVKAGLPVFVSECGITSADGDGDMDFDEAGKWLDVLDQYGICRAFWNLSDKNEASAMVKALNADGLSPKALTRSGLYVRAVLRGEDPVKAQSLYQEEPLSQRPLLLFAVLLGGSGLLLGGFLLLQKKSRNVRSYDALLRKTGETGRERRKAFAGRKSVQRIGKLFIVLDILTGAVYILWRGFFTLPLSYGAVAVIAGVILFAAEAIGFLTSLIHFFSMTKLRDYPLPQIEKEQYPEVDVFVATYNESPELLRKTLIGCQNMEYPDSQKVHIYLCDDNRRPAMRTLAQTLGVGYFDRPDHTGAKAGNLNNALRQTASPLVVTFDADMIPKKDFLMKTVPYFVDAHRRNQMLPQKERMPLGFVQTPQAFYNSDIFQHNLYCEKHIPNEQDFFYRTVEPSRTATNSVIYGGSNTVLSREALEQVGGFYMETITEDLATGVLITDRGYISLALDTPLASGLCPESYQEFIKQRIRWSRGCILTYKKLKLFRRKGLTLTQKLSFLSSILYWFFPVFDLIYTISPLLYVLLGVRVVACSWQTLALFWLPSFLLNDLCLRTISNGSVSEKWTCIYKMSLTPFLLLPVLKETFGISLTSFQVTQKGIGEAAKNRKLQLPYLCLAVLDAAAIVKVVIQMRSSGWSIVSFLVILFWLIRNLYMSVMCLLLADSRPGDGEVVRVKEGEPAVIVTQDGRRTEAITTLLTEHSVTLFPDQPQPLGTHLTLELFGLVLEGVVVGMKKSKKACILTVELLEYHGSREAYIYSLYNRIPTLPQSYYRDLGYTRCLWRNLAARISLKE